MPLAALVCPCCSQNVTPDEALEHLSQRPSAPISYELLSAMLAEVQDRGDRISTTTLTAKCLRSEFLKRKTKYVEDPEKLYASFKGTMLHGRLELNVAPGSVAEARYWAETPYGPLSGSPDLVDPKVGYLYDYKTTKEAPRFAPWGDHVDQLQVNRWLVDHAHTAEFKVAGETVSFDLTDQTIRPRFVPVDWQGLIVVYLDEKGSRPMLITRSEKVPTKDGKGTKPRRVPDIWSDEKAEEFIAERYQAAKTALEGNVLPDITPAYENWAHPLCPYCPVKQRCIDEYITTQVQLRSTQS